MKYIQYLKKISLLGTKQKWLKSDSNYKNLRTNLINNFDRLTISDRLEFYRYVKNNQFKMTINVRLLKVNESKTIIIYYCK